MKRWSGLILSLMILLAASAPHASAAPAKKARRQAKAAPAVPVTAIKPREEVYKTIGDVQLKMFIFEPKDRKPGVKYPAIVFFFGGGWVSGAPVQFYHHCDALAARGMVAMAAEYRIQSRNNTTPVECVKDGKSAIRWVRANATRLGVDPDRIAAGGGSAGGHVAAATAMSPGLEEAGEDASVSCRPNALVLYNPVFDNGPKGYGYDRVKASFPAISPIHNIRKGLPPAIVFLGTADRLIPVATARDFESKMKENGNRCDLSLYEGQAHGFFNYKDSGNPYYLKTLAETDKFLVSLGWLQASQ